MFSLIHNLEEIAGEIVYLAAQFKIEVELLGWTGANALVEEVKLVKLEQAD